MTSMGPADDDNSYVCQVNGFPVDTHEKTATIRVIVLLCHSNYFVEIMCKLFKFGRHLRVALRSDQLQSS